MENKSELRSNVINCYHILKILIQVFFFLLKILKIDRLKSLGRSGSGFAGADLMEPQDGKQQRR